MKQHSQNTPEDEEDIHQKISDKLQELGSERRTRSSVVTARKNVDKFAGKLNEVVAGYNEPKSGVPRKPKAKHITERDSGPVDSKKAGCLMSTLERLDIGVGCYNNSSGGKRYEINEQKDDEEIQKHVHYALRHTNNYRPSKKRSLENVSPKKIHEETRALKEFIDEEQPEEQSQPGQRVWGTVNAVLETQEPPQENTKPQDEAERYMIKALEHLPGIDIGLEDNQIKTYPSLQKRHNQRKVIRAADFYGSYLDSQT